MPELDISDRDSRKLRIQLSGTRLSIWLDDQPVVERLAISERGRGSVAFVAEVWKETERFSQTNLYDDVYDAVFIDPVIRDLDDEKSIFYQYTLQGTQAMEYTFQNVIGNILDFFVEHF